jgi:hypothetical protein
VKESFSLENFGIKVTAEKVRSQEDQRALSIPDRTIKYDGSRYEVGLLWKDDDPTFPESKRNAMQRLQCAERKMDKDSVAAKAHCDKMEEYIQKGFLVKLTENDKKTEPKKTFYLPHFLVQKPHKPGKFRLVFDAAAKAHGVSLNDKLLTCPDLLNPLPSVLMRFRQRKVAFSADIRDMFHQVRVRPEDHCSQRLFWRGMDRLSPPIVYEMKVLIFGAASSPTSALYVTHFNAKSNEREFNEACGAILRNEYMDDYMDSRTPVEEAVRLVGDVVEVHKKGGFEIINWISNSKELLESIPLELRGERMKNLETEPNGVVERILGLHWDTEEDILVFQTSFKKIDPAIIKGDKAPTKREVLGVVMSMFDV